MEQNIAYFASELGCSPDLVQHFSQLADERCGWPTSLRSAAAQAHSPCLAPFHRTEAA